MSEETKPSITTIISTYRRPKFLQRAIKSVLNQTYPYFQVCVYDNASGDETAEVVAKLSQREPRIKYYCHSENIGAVASINYGFERVDTPFFSFLSDDDILLPEFYEIALEGFKKNPKAFFSSTATLNSDNRDNIWWDLSSPKWIPGFYQPPEGLLTMLKNGHPSWIGILFRREVIESVGMLDNKVGPSADLDFKLRIAAHLPFVISLKPGAIFVSHPLSFGSQECFYDIWPGWLKMIRNLTEDKVIPVNARAYAGQMLTEIFKGKLYFIGLRSILQKNFDDPQKVSEVLRNHYHLSKKAFFLSIIAKACNHSSALCDFAIFLNKIRRFFFIKKLQYSQKKDILMYIKKL